MNKGYLVVNYDKIKRIISLDIDGEIKTYYLSRTLNKLYYTVIKKGDIYLSFSLSDKSKIIDNNEVLCIIKINSITLYNGEYIELYDSSIEKNDVKELINSLKYKMFVDFEFTMPPYNYEKKFIPEIIQIGSVITDEDDLIVNEYSEYIKSKRKISDRTISFLRLTSEELNESVNQKVFYSNLKKLVDIYNPVAITWGSSDKTALSQFYQINKVEPLDLKFIDLSKLIKKYFSLSNDLGLFNALKIFSGIDASQAHHALTDAAATKEVFVAFKEIVINDKEFKIKEKIEEIK